MTRSIAYIGTYTRQMAHVDGKGAGIYTVELCYETGALRLVGNPVEAPNSSYLCQNQLGDRLYAISEICDYRGKQDGSLSAFSIEGGKLSQLQQCSSSGMGPAYIRIDHSGCWLLVANYVQGNIVVYPILEDGTLGPVSEDIQFSGSGPDTVRQEAPHPHAVLPSPDNRFVYAIDLGTDWIRGYHFNVETGRLRHDRSLDLFAGAGTGPRHFVFHPDGAYAYFVKELTSELSICHFDVESGRLEILQAISTLPAGFEGESHCSEIVVTGDGRYIYIANRGHDSIAIFEISDDHMVESKGHVDCGGHIPRHICLSPDWQFLLVANQESDQLVSLRRDEPTGQLELTGKELSIPTPCFIEFQRIPR